MMLKRIIIPIIIFLLLFSHIPEYQTQQLTTINLPWKHQLTSTDEGAHYPRLISMREWWYFNIIFDHPQSSLHNWSAMISFNHMSKSFDEPDILFITLYDTHNNTYGGMITGEQGTLKADKYTFNLTYHSSWACGTYPNWQLHVEDENADTNHTIIMDLSFTTSCKPYWVGCNTGLGSPWSLLGYYSINHCIVTGTVQLDNATYNVYGTGYYDHFWLPFSIGGSGFFWDWFSVHFDNGLHGFIWHIIPASTKQSHSRRPGFCWITDGDTFTDFHFFMIEYLSYENTSIPNVIRPREFFLSSTSSNTKLNLVFKTENMHEYVWEQPVEIGLWEGSCSVRGTIEINSQPTSVKGSAISEILRLLK
jgi:predicted secreted hydrolase